MISVLFPVSLNSRAIAMMGVQQLPLLLSALPKDISFLFNVFHRHEVSSEFPLCRRVVVCIAYASELEADTYSFCDSEIICICSCVAFNGGSKKTTQPFATFIVIPAVFFLEFSVLRSVSN